LGSITSGHKAVGDALGGVPYRAKAVELGGRKNGFVAGFARIQTDYALIA